MGRKLLLHWIPVLGLIAAGPMEARQLAREGRPAAEILIATKALPTEIYEAKGYDGSWSTAWIHRVARLPDRWEMLVTIPLEAVGYNLTENNKLRFVAYRSKYYFLHDNAITWYDGELVAAWYNCPRGEMEEISCIRARRSHDGGLTWSAPEVVAADTSGDGILYVPVALASHADRLSRAWLIRRGPDVREGIGPEWSYPCAIERDGRLYIIYSSEKHHSARSIVPVAALR